MEFVKADKYACAAFTQSSQQKRVSKTCTVDKTYFRYHHAQSAGCAGDLKQRARRGVPLASKI